MPTTPPGAPRGSIAAIFALIAAVTFIAYIPAISGEFLWDDAGHVTPPALQSWAGLGRIWFEIGATQQYYPLLHTAFWIQHQIWGEASAGYHVINVCWHVIAAGLLVTLLRRLAVPGAGWAGLVFALHPVNVESVAWISEQKNTLSTVFYLAAALAWLRFETDRRPLRYGVATCWFGAALLTKSVTATLPAALLVIAWWRRGRLSWRDDVVPLLPWMGLGVVAGGGTLWFESTQIGAQGEAFNFGLLERVLLAGRVGWFYAGKLLWPTDLIFFYPRWLIDAARAEQWIFPIATALLLAVLAWGQKHQRAPLAAALLYGGTLFPVLGFVNVYPFVFSYVADHFQYLASLSMIAFLVAVARLGWARWRGPNGSGFVVATLGLLLLGGLTWQQCGMYRDGRTLYETTLERNPESWVAHLNLGIILDEAGETEKSLVHLQRARELKPNFPETLNTLGNVLNRLGRSREALPWLEQAVKLQPRFAAAHNGRGAALMSLGRAEEGITAFRRAVELDPTWALPRLNLAWAMANHGRVTEAMVEFEQVRRLQPELAEAETKWGLAWVLHGQVDEALPHLKRAVALQPDDPEAHHNLARVLLRAGQRTAAIAQFETVLRLNPNHNAASEALAALRQSGSTSP